MPSRRRLRGFSVALLAVALVATGCASAPPEPTPTPAPVVYPPQPAFAHSPDPLGAIDAPTADSTVATLTSDYQDKGTTIDVSALLNGSQGSYPPMRNLNWLTNQAAQMSSMGLNEIRVDDVFNDATYGTVTRDAAGAIVYDFTRLDQVLLTLEANGLTPFIVLSYMPAALGPVNTGPPTSLDEWSAAVSAFVTHYAEIGHAGWSYEVWNELDTELWKGTAAQYIDLYAASAIAVKSADPTATVGGAAASDLVSPGGWSRQFIDFVSANPTVPIDFFSVHSYRASDWSTIGTARAWLNEIGRSDLPIYVTEWNDVSFMDHGPGQGSDTNASVDGSSYVARRLFLAMDSAVDKLFYFSPVEGLNYQLPYNGDLGLVSVDGHRKSSSNVFEMYSKVDELLLPSTVEGVGTESRDVFGFVTKDKGGKTAEALLWNRTFSDVTFTVSLEGLPYTDSNFSVTEKVVSTAKGNGFNDSPLAVAPTYPSANELAPVVSRLSVKGSSTYEREVTVPANGIVSLSLAATKSAPGELPVSAGPAAINLAATASGAVASASTSVEVVKDNWGIATVNDGRRHTFEPRKISVRGWSSEPHVEPVATEFVAVDLGSSKPVDTVVLWPRDSQLNNGVGFPVDFTIQGSIDGVTWTTLYTATGYNGGEPVHGAQTFEFAAAEWRHLKVEATTLSAVPSEGAHAFQLTELEAYRNGVIDGGFESATLDAWATEGKVAATSESVRSGQHSLRMTGKNARISTLITGLIPNTEYTFGGHLRSETDKDEVKLTVDGFGDSALTRSTQADHWHASWLTFTTGPEATSATVSVAKTGGSGTAWSDDFMLTQAAE